MTPGVERVAEAAVRRVAAQVAERARDVRGLEMKVDGNAVTVRGRALSRRLVEEPALSRWEGAR